MTCNVCSVYKGLFFICILSSPILLKLMSCNVLTTPVIENITSNLSDSNESISVEETSTQNIILQEQSNESNKFQSPNESKEKEIDPVIGKEFIFSESLSQNSAMASGELPDTGQPVLITLVDTAAAELTNAIIDHLDQEKLENNSTESSRGYNANPVIVNVTNISETVEVKKATESHEVPKPEIVVIATPQEKKDERILEKVESVEDSTNVTSSKGVELNATIDEDPLAKKDVMSTPAPNQIQEEIPSFSEWAQKQLEEEKSKDNSVNRSTQSVQGNGGLNTNIKVRSKNYASPDCGAKIMAANPEAGSSSYILTPNKDEYMLNTCNSRIWFVVELCEAIQAKKVDLANFELFSSTPKEFSVFVSDRFPTREWTSVGHFTAKDEKDVQTFNLHPHLFGKYVKVEIQSYYGSEHYCPISLFRVYGTSEYEVFETENSPPSQTSQTTDDDDDILEDMNITEKEDQSRNLFGSARDAVLSIVKKAAQVLVKGSDKKNITEMIQIETPKSNKCKTPSHIIVCDNCSNSMFRDVFNLMSCQTNDIDRLVQTPIIRDTLCNTDICSSYGLDFKTRRTLYATPRISSYISTFFFPSYIAALCNMLAVIEKKVVLNTSYETDLNVTTNLTIDKKTHHALQDGKIDELLQKPFTACTDPTDPQCKRDADQNVKVDLQQPIKVVPEIVENDLSGIKPTKTIQRNSDYKHPVLTITGTIPEVLTQPEEGLQFSEVNTESVLDVKTPTTDVTREPIVQRPLDKPDTEQQNKSTDSQEILGGEEKPSLSSQDPNANIGTSESTNASGEIVDESGLKISTQEQISLDNLLKEWEQAAITDNGQSQSSNTNMPSSQGQKESVFLRLSNRIKALERNMSLSGQYLEELSRRYKKQMEEMQKTFEKTLSAVSEEAKRAEERDSKNSEEMLQLQKQIMELSESVNVLVSERESWFGTLSLTKIILVQIIITALVLYLASKYRVPPATASPERRTSKTKVNNNRADKVKRKFSEVPMSGSDSSVKIKKRRPSEEALHIARTASDMRENLLKAEKKKRKRKSPIVQRSYSIAAPQQNDGEWTALDFSKNTLNTPIVLDEPEFVIPEMDPSDFYTDSNVPNLLNGEPSSSKTQPLPNKMNGSAFEKKTPESKKTEKSRRLSSPAFFKAALGRSSTKSSNTPPPRRSVSPVLENNRKMLPLDREVKSEERTTIRRETNSPQLSMWSSVGDMSDTSGSVRVDTQNIKKKRSKRSFKTIFKKVF